MPLKASLKNATSTGIDVRTIAILASVVVSIASASYFAGYMAKGMLDREKEIEELRVQIKDLETELKQYTDLEVGGLRADWERELEHGQHGN